jgi:hypothetical protein
MGASVILSLWLAWLPGINAEVQTRPDFSGRWTFDQARSAKPWNGRIVIAPILGDECVATQDGESRNLSPGDIPVTSRTLWNGVRLVIASTSAATVKGQDITIETRRVLRLDAEGNLIIERTGTPASEVTPSRSVYTRAR